MPSPRKRMKKAELQSEKMVSIPKSKAQLTNLSPELLQIIVDYVCQKPIARIPKTDYT